MNKIKKSPSKHITAKKKNVYSIPSSASAIGKSNTTMMTKTQFIKVLIATPSTGRISALYIQITGPSEIPNPI